MDLTVSLLHILILFNLFHHSWLYTEVYFMPKMNQNHQSPAYESESDPCAATSVCPNTNSHKTMTQISSLGDLHCCRSPKTHVLCGCGFTDCCLLDFSHASIAALEMAMSKLLDGLPWKSVQIFVILFLTFPRFKCNIWTTTGWIHVPPELIITIHHSLLL